jgi:predicted permease
VTRRRPPALARWIVTLAVRDPHREFLLGDLDEQFDATAADVGRGRARRRYWRQALGTSWQAWSLRNGRLDPSPKRNISMSNIWTDLRIGIRTAWRSRGYSAVSILTLALALGANTLLFSIANPLVVRPLPLQDPDGLGWIEMSHAERGVDRENASLPDFLEWRSGLQSYSALAGWTRDRGTLLGHGDARSILVARMTANLSEVWGLRPHLGRLLQPGEDEVGREQVGVLSHRFWRDEFQSDPDAVGQTFTINSRSTTIVGVMMPEIELGSLALIDVWTPLELDVSAARDDRVVTPVGRLAPDATLESANAELQALFASQSLLHEEALRGWEPRVASTTEALASSESWLILALLGIVVAFVLMIACANLANLVLARLTARRQEFMVRFALGASRWQVVRPLLLEGILLSVVGGVAGLGLAYGGLRPPKPDMGPALPATGRGIGRAMFSWPRRWRSRWHCSWCLP